MLAPKELDQASKELLIVADYIAQHGWCQYRLHSESGSCLIGAFYATRIMSITDEPPPSSLGLLKFRDYLRDKGHDGLVADWNDAKGRTKEEVIEALREAAYL